MRLKQNLWTGDSGAKAKMNPSTNSFVKTTTKINTTTSTTTTTTTTKTTATPSLSLNFLRDKQTSLENIPLNASTPILIASVNGTTTAEKVQSATTVSMQTPKFLSSNVQMSTAIPKNCALTASDVLSDKCGEPFNADTLCVNGVTTGITSMQHSKTVPLQQILMHKPATSVELIRAVPILNKDLFKQIVIGDVPKTNSLTSAAKTGITLLKANLIRPKQQSQQIQEKIVNKTMHTSSDLSLMGATTKLPTKFAAEATYICNNNNDNNVNNNNNHSSYMKIVSKVSNSPNKNVTITSYPKCTDISLPQSPPQVTHISNSVILTKLANSHDNKMRAPEPATVTIKKVPTASNQLQSIKVTKNNQMSSQASAETQIPQKPQSKSMEKFPGKLVQESLLKATAVTQHPTLIITNPRTIRSKSDNCTLMQQECCENSCQELRRHSMASESQIITNQSRIQKLKKILNETDAEKTFDIIEYDENYLDAKANCVEDAAYSVKSCDSVKSLDTKKSNKNLVSQIQTSQSRKRKMSLIAVKSMEHLKNVKSPAKKLALNENINNKPQAVYSNLMSSAIEIQAEPQDRDSIKKCCYSSLLCDEELQISSPPSTAPVSVSRAKSSTTSFLLSEHKYLSNKEVIASNSVPEMPTEVSEFAVVLDIMANLNMLIWKERMGRARGTNAQFELNEFNMVQIHDAAPKRVRPHTDYMKPIYEREFLPQKPTFEDQGLFLCRSCNCHGSVSDFLAPGFCSLECVKRDIMKQPNVTVNPLRKRPRKDSLKPHGVPASTKKEIFRWTSYLKKQNNAIAAPLHLFSNSFPTEPNRFEVGMKVEAIDPENCALFCVCTVIAVQGYRLKLNFDGFDSMYDFWINADSLDIFPPGWCNRTGRTLQPPKGIPASEFMWSDYLSKANSVPPRLALFKHLQKPTEMTQNCFKIGMFLEAEDLNDTGKLCVATVADVLNDRIRVHFNGWDECYDYWVNINSPYIHPCGWAEGLHQLIVPPDYEQVSFNWNDYISQQNALHGANNVAAGEIVFMVRNPILFKPNMKLEVVDPRNSSLIRPASVIGRKGYRIKLHLDGWPFEYCFWIEDDSPDLHPVGWSKGTGTDLEPPPGYHSGPIKMLCSIDGCRGIGNANRFSLQTHASVECCPYNLTNWCQKTEKPPRLSGHEIVRPSTLQQTITELNIEKLLGGNLLDPKIENCVLTSKPNITEPSSSLTNFIFSKPVKVGKSSILNKKVTEEKTQIDPEIEIVNIKQEILESDDINMPQQIDDTKINQEPISTEPFDSKGDVNVDIESSHLKLNSDAGSSNLKLSLSNREEEPKPLDSCVQIAKNFLCDYGPRLEQNYNLWQKNFTIDLTKIKTNPMLWSSSQTVEFLKTVSSLKSLSPFTAFEREDIDGPALLLLQRSDLIERLNMKVGPAVKMYSTILELRTLVHRKFGYAKYH